jgi:hypothetical protein
MLNVENCAVVSANIAVAMFTLKKATTVFVEMLDHFQHSTWLLLFPLHTAMAIK